MSNKRTVPFLMLMGVLALFSTGCSKDDGSNTVEEQTVNPPTSVDNTNTSVDKKDYVVAKSAYITSTYGPTWEQPTGYKYYRIHVRNLRDTELNVEVKIGEKIVYNFSVPAGGFVIKSITTGPQGTRNVFFYTADDEVLAETTIRVSSNILK